MTHFRPLPKYSLLKYLPALFLLISCSPELDLKSKKLIYQNEFNDSNLDQIVGGLLHTYNNEMMLGNFNNDGFVVLLKDLPKHDEIVISFDLYIHDSWDGNQSDPGGPDIWSMQLDNLLEESDTYTQTFSTTFSNSVCDSELCALQAYPMQYPFSNQPKTGAKKQDLPGNCIISFDHSYSSLYKINKVFKHNSQALAINFFDQLTQKNAERSYCDESWSLDNLKIWTIKFE